jgi:hypothetical protein
MAMFFFLASSDLIAGVDPTSASWTLYKVNLYQSGDCTGTPQTVLDNPAGETSNFVEGPTLGSTEIDNGTYNCVAVKMSDAVTFVPSANDGDDCVNGNSYTIYVCPNTESYYDPDTDSNIPCAAGENTMWVYISTYSTSESGGGGNDAFKPPTSEGDAVNGIKLGNALVVDGDSSHTFVIDTSGKVSDMGASCELDQPAFSFD